MIRYIVTSTAMILVSLLAGCSTSNNSKSSQTILNVSYDPTRELYTSFNAAFAKFWKKKTGQVISVKQSHGGSGNQARSVIDGLEADVVTLALAYDIDAISRTGAIPEHWERRLPKHSCPYTSTIVFLVRAGNPKNINDWPDLVRPDITIISPNPKTSGGARWAYCAAWGYALKQPLATEETAREFVKKLYRNVPVMDAGARGSLTTFVERGMGDALLTWENEAMLAVREAGTDHFQIVVPSISILAEPPVSLVDKNVDKHGTRELAQSYLDYLYSEDGQEIAARNFYRPTLASVVQKYQSIFPTMNFFTIEELFGNWEKVQKKHFDDNGYFDQIFTLSDTTANLVSSKKSLK